MFFFFFFPGTTTCVRENLSTRTSFKKMIIKLLIHNDNKISKRWNYFGWKHDLWRHIYFFVFYELIMFEIVIQMCYFLESISPKNLLICLHYHSKTALFPDFLPKKPWVGLNNVILTIAYHHHPPLHVKADSSSQLFLQAIIWW